MFRKLITSILIIILLGQMGCYTSTQITLEELIESEELGDISLTTNDTLNYMFEENNYVIKSDTLCGKGIKLNKERGKRNFEGCIPTTKIHSVEVRRFDPGWLAIGSGILICGMIVIISDWLPDLSGLK